MGDFSHLNEHGKADMVDISDKTTTRRNAIVIGRVNISKECSRQLTADGVSEIITTARLAGISASKQTALLVPLCHQVPLSKVGIKISFDRDSSRFDIEANTTTTSATGVEMEAFVAANLAGITIYDMVKAVDPAAVIGNFKLIKKTGGKAGEWKRG